PSMNGWVTTREDFPRSRHFWMNSAQVSAGYFDALDIPVVEGRAFSPGDGVDTPQVAVVSESFARTLWPGRRAIGQTFTRHEPNSTYPPRWLEVVGVVGDIQPPLSDAPQPAFYVSLEQQQNPIAFTVVARGTGPLGDLVRRIRDAVQAADSTVVVT